MKKIFFGIKLNLIKFLIIGKLDCLKYIKLWKSNLKDFNLNNENKVILFNNDDKCI